MGEIALRISIINYHLKYLFTRDNFRRKFSLVLSISTIKRARIA